MADRGLRRGWRVVRGIMLGIDQFGQQRIDFGWFEAGDFEVQVTFNQKLCQFRELNAEHRAVPAGVEGNFVIRDRKGALFCFAQAGDNDNRNLLEPEAFSGKRAPMSGDEQ